MKFGFRKGFDFDAFSQKRRFKIEFVIKITLLAFSGFAICVFHSSCNKLVQVPNPISSVTANQVFSSDATATAAMLGIYSYMSGHGASFSNLYTTEFPGESADELTDETSGNEKYDIFLSNTLTPILGAYTVLGDFWQPAYFDIYSANAVIAGVQSSSGVSIVTKNQLTGEAKFLRAFCYFYLTNIFGDIPLVLSTDFNQTALLSKTPRAAIYQQITADLLDAQNLMRSDFSLSGGQPIRANKWAATALLARVYQYQGQWESADSAANAVINSGQFSLVPLATIPSNGVPSSDSDVFAANSVEAILQLQTVNAFVTQEAAFFVPSAPNQGYPRCWLTSQLLAAFETGDLRMSNWTDSTNEYGRSNYLYYPYKYKINSGSSMPALENYTLLRLAEQYLIRAEAEANLSQPGLAIEDVNTIRMRAGLDSLSSSLSSTQILAAIQQEYRIEFFAEWGHRWFDLKRWGIAIDTLSNIAYKRGSIDSTQLLYPIPISEMQTDPNLTQNPGYSN